MSGAQKIDCVWKAKALLGEGPCRDRRTNEVFWVDIGVGRLHAFAIETGMRRFWTPPHCIYSVDVPPISWTPPAPGAQWLVGCTSVGFAWIGVRPEDIVIQALSHPESDRTRNRFNDGKMGPDGRYWAGTMDCNETDASGALYAFTGDGECEVIDEGYVVSNGPAFSPDGRTLYHTDSARRVIYAFDLNYERGASNRRVFCGFEESDGCPDGMTTDRAGNLWVAMWDGGRVLQISDSGKRLQQIELPTARPTSCVFADEAQRILFVTSASIGRPSTDTLAGGLFRIELNAP